MSDRDVPPAEEAASGLARIRLTRAGLLKRGAAGAAAAAGAGLIAGDVQAKEEGATAALRFLTQWEFDYLTAMAEVIWPTDDLGPGAREAGVANYIDGQLAGSWGQGHRFYLNGPFYTPVDTGHGWQIPLAPADVYRAFLPQFDVYCKTTYGNPFTVLPAATQTQAISDLQTGKMPGQLAGSLSYASNDFYSLFRQNVLEGMLSDPSYGGNRDMVGWKFLGFPGDPMRRGDVYEKYVFTTKAYPYENKPLPLQPAAAKAGVTHGAAASAATKPANAATNKLMGGM